MDDDVPTHDFPEPDLLLTSPQEDCHTRDVPLSNRIVEHSAYVWTFILFPAAEELVFIGTPHSLNSPTTLFSNPLIRKPKHPPILQRNHALTVRLRILGANFSARD